jgi:beta-lactamase superfamily II metal-dependent hydrolase
MFYINHNSDNFTIIDSCIGEDNEAIILDEISALQKTKGITRFISTHPDNDHMLGLDLLDDRIAILNFYCVKNAATKAAETACFTRYCQLRDSDKAFYIFKGCKRRWMNQDDGERKNSGIDILWPDVENEHFQEALAGAANGGSPNNISAIVQYSLQNGVTALWMGDLETEFMELIEDDLDLPTAHVLFAPHHGRESGKVPESLLEKMSPKIIVIGEAPSEHLNYYAGYNVLTQNSAGDILFDCVTAKVHVFTSKDYKTDFLDDEHQTQRGYYYAGTLNLT